MLCSDPVVTPQVYPLTQGLCRPLGTCGTPSLGVDPFSKNLGKTSGERLGCGVTTGFEYDTNWELLRMDDFREKLFLLLCWNSE